MSDGTTCVIIRTHPGIRWTGIALLVPLVVAMGWQAWAPHRSGNGWFVISILVALYVPLLAWPLAQWGRSITTTKRALIAKSLCRRRELEWNELQSVVIHTGSADQRPFVIALYFGPRRHVVRVGAAAFGRPAVARLIEVVNEAVPEVARNLTGSGPVGHYELRRWNRPPAQ